MNCIVILTVSHTIHPPPVPRFTGIVELICRAVACCGGPRPIGISGLPVQGHPGSLITLIWTRLRRIITRFTRAATIPQGPIRLRAKRTNRPRPVEPLTLPRHYGWLRQLIQETSGGASQLYHFLNDPEVAALVAADPRLGRILRPLCHMLRIKRSDVPLLYPQPPPKPPAPSPQPPDASAIPGDAPPQAAPLADAPPPPPDPPPPIPPSSIPVPSAFLAASE